MPLQKQLPVNLRFLCLVLILICLQGCAVGIMKVEGPELPLIKDPVSMDRDVYFEVCVPPDLRNKGWNDAMNKKIEWILHRDFALLAHPEAPAPDKPYFQFIFTEIADTHYFASALISFLTFGAIPGYAVDQRKIDIQFQARDSNGETIQGRYRYEYRDRYFLWLPLILYPDIFASVNGGYINKSKENLGLTLVISRFVIDASQRMRQQPKETKTADALPILKCPGQ